MKLFCVFELGILCGVVIMCIMQGGRNDENKKKK